MRPMDEADAEALEEMRIETEEHRASWDALMARRDKLVTRIVKDNPKTTRVDIGLRLEVSDTIIRRCLATEADRLREEALSAGD